MHFWSLKASVTLMYTNIKLILKFVCGMQGNNLLLAVSGYLLNAMNYLQSCRAHCLVLVQVLTYLPLGFASNPIQ